MAKKQEATIAKKVKKQHKTKAQKPLLPRAVRLAVEQVRSVKAEAKAEREAKVERDRLAKEAAEKAIEERRVFEATNNWIDYWKYIAVTYGFCKLEQFANPQPELKIAIDRLFNYGGHNDPRPGIQMLIGEEYYGTCVNGIYYIAHNEMVDANVVEEAEQPLKGE